MNLEGVELRDEIADLEFWTASLPLRRPYVHATTAISALESVIVRVRLSSGHVGLSEVRGNGGYATGEDTSQISSALAALDFSGERPTIDTVVRHLIETSTLAAMAVDVAGWDAQARRAGVPLYRFWKAEAPAQSEIRTHASISFTQNPTCAIDFVREGFDRIKVRVGSTDPDRDVARLRAIAEFTNYSVGLIADANGGWDVEQTLHAEAQLRELPVLWIEQPVATLRELHEVRGRTQLCVYADELARGPESIAALAEAVDGVHLKLEKCGTVANLFASVDTARKLGLTVALGQMDQGRLGCAVTTQLAVALELERAELWGCAETRIDLTDELRMENGKVLVPRGPGSGIQEINESILRKVT